MQVYCNGLARIRHKTTGIIYELKSEKLDWDQVDADERAMGSELRYEAALEHPELGLLVWSLWEYPIGIENYHETNAGGHKIIEDFNYGLEPDGSYVYDPDYDLPDDPYSISMASLREASRLLLDRRSDYGGALLYRMIFSHLITALEAYLADTLIKAVLVDKAAMRRLLERDNELGKQRFSLGEIGKASNLVEKKVHEYLLSIRYHNLAKVDFLYKTALQVAILDLSKDKATLFKAIEIRHDCVHRNGFDKEGNPLAVLTDQYVQETADLIMDFVEKINEQVHGPPF